MNKCVLCGRETKQGLTEHHLIPRTCHSNKWFKKRFTREQMQETIRVCRECHSAIHDLFPDEKELGRNWNTLELLRDEPRMARFIQWVRKQRWRATSRSTRNVTLDSSWLRRATEFVRRLDERYIGVRQSRERAAPNSL